jgi:hypothetical protein
MEKLTITSGSSTITTNIITTATATTTKFSFLN